MEQQSPYQPPMEPSPGQAASKVQAPAIGLIITAVIGLLVQSFNLIRALLVGGADPVDLQGAQGMEELTAEQMEMITQIFQGVGFIGIVLAIIGAIVGLIILFGAVKMLKLESWGMAMTASVLAMIPCISPCCLLGLPIGIWSMVVLLSEDVKSAFRG